MTFFLRVLASVSVAAFVTCTTANAADPPRFESHVAPILNKHCVRCHNSRTRKAELDLSSAAGLFRGGESGGIVTVGKPDESLLYEMVQDDLMPPEDDRKRALTVIEKATLREWLAAGAHLTSGVDPKKLLARSQVSNLEIEPLMHLRCTVCHGLRKQEGGLDLRTAASMKRGGKSGPAFVPGKPDQSLLLKKIHAGEMPPKAQLVRSGVRPMTPAEIERLTQWIALGAPELPAKPDVASNVPDTLVTEEDRKFWAFQPPQAGVPPRVRGANIRNAIDAFVVQQQRIHSLKQSSEADKLTLLRRATFDLTGLPPTREQMVAYLTDHHPLAYERMLDRLLQSPRYGERWAQFWLDAAGYADSEGKRSADPIRAYAYRYRDYVIRAFNSDKPYDRFLLEQIAGDELVDYENAEVFTEQMADNLIATGFLRLAPDGTGSDIVNTVAERMEVVADEIDIFSSTVMALTMKCARCHSHKYDPLPQRDYYRLAAVFKGALDQHDWLKPTSVPGQSKSNMGGRYLDLLTDQQREAWKEQVEEIEAEIQKQQKKLDELAWSIRLQHLEEELKQHPAEQRNKLRAAFTTAAEKRSPDQQQLVAKFQKRLWLSDKQVKAAEGYKRPALAISRVLKQLEKEKLDRPKIRALWDRGEPSPTYIYIRGDFQQTGRLVGPGVPSVLTDGKTPFQVQPPWPRAKKTGRRLALARWLTTANHPLTARVMVNRIWRHHFGRGIVKSVDNFGELGSRPTHPKLLDWLAVEFVDRGWSVKEMHRLIMTSATYRQSSALTTEHEQLDPENKWLSRAPLRRLDAEQVRDSLLFVSGQLNERPFGRPDAVDVRGDGLVTSIGEKGSWRRSIYVRHRRREMPSVLETFDLPQMNPACQERPTSTVAQQSLYLLNNQAIRQLSDAFAERIARQTTDPVTQIELVFQTALTRKPSENERRLARQTLSQLTEAWRKQTDSKDPRSAESRALAVFCHTIMNSAAFLYID